MAHRYASERGWRVAAIVSLAGSIWNLRPPFATAPANRVSVLQIHATNDTLIPFYDGYSITTFLGYFFFGAYHTIDVWACRNGCTHPPFQGFLPASGDRFNLVAPSVAHPDLYETTRLPAFGCPPSIGVELWKIDGSFLTTFNLQGHAPAFNGGVFATETLNWLQAHSKAL